jgi:tRNA A-37 threonylcarbamoyl transferase component Bud32
MTVTESGRVIAGRYRLVAPIGRGGAGIVWRARDDLLDREVAVKEIVRLATVEEEERAESYRRTLREARAAARINHPGVAAVYDVVSEDGCPYIVMELIDGRPLSRLIGDGRPLPPAQVADFGRQVLAALLAGHAAGVLHRDLKPGNVLITPGGRAVLTDFGIASVVGDPSITRTGVVVGTPGYLAPERIRGESATPAADLWSLGATLYAACCGQGPYDGYDGAIATMFAIATEDPPVMAVAGPLRGIIGALLSRDPRLRPGAAETAQALDAATDSLARDEYAWSLPVAGPLPAPAMASPAVEPPPVEAPLAEGPRTVTSERLPVRHRTDPDLAVSALLEAPVSAADFTFMDDDRDITSRPARPVRPGRGGGRHRAVLVAGLAAVVVAASVAITVALSSNSTPKVASTAFQTPVTEAFRVATAVNADGTTELVAVAQDGSLMQDHFVNGSWSGWAGLPGGLPGGQNFTGIPAIGTSADGRLVIFARTTGREVAELWQSTPGSQSWQGPATLGTEQISSDPAVVSMPGGHLEVFARLGNGGLGAVSQLSAADLGRWSGWTSLGGTLGGPPVTAVNGNRLPEIFALAPNGSLMHDPYRNGSWAGWSALPGGQAFTGVPAVGKNADGRLELFARTKSGAIEHVWQVPGGSGGWDGAPVLIGNAVSDPAVFSANEGRLEIFAVVAKGKMMHTWQLQPVAGTAWNRPQSLAGHSVGAPAAIRVNGHSQLFARGPDGKIGYDHLDGSTGAWSGWSALPGGTF